MAFGHAPENRLEHELACRLSPPERLVLAAEVGSDIPLFLLGGALVTLDIAGLGWRVVFLVNVPFGLAIIAAAAFIMPSKKTRYFSFGTAPSPRATFHLGRMRSMAPSAL